MVSGVRLDFMVCYNTRCSCCVSKEVLGHSYGGGKSVFSAVEVRKYAGLVDVVTPA